MSVCSFHLFSSLFLINYIMCVSLMSVTCGPVRSLKRRTENMFRTIRNEWPVVFSGITFFSQRAFLNLLLFRLVKSSPVKIMPGRFSFYKGCNLLTKKSTLRANCVALHQDL